MGFITQRAADRAEAERRKKVALENARMMQEADRAAQAHVELQPTKTVNWNTRDGFHDPFKDKPLPMWPLDAPQATPDHVKLWTDYADKYNALRDREEREQEFNRTAATAMVAPRRLLHASSAERKNYPMAEGLLDYFPDALAEVAKLSKMGNDKHNPGQPMHHARGKSMDHADCIMRHLVGRGGFDGETRESAALAWRALALLQEELEKEFKLTLPRAARTA